MQVFRGPKRDLWLRHLDQHSVVGRLSDELWNVQSADQTRWLSVTVDDTSFVLW